MVDRGVVMRRKRAVMWLGRGRNILVGFSWVARRGGRVGIAWQCMSDKAGG